MTFGYVVLFLVPNLFWAWFVITLQTRWEIERHALLDRVQAGSFNEYQHLKTPAKPRVHNPLRKGLYPDDIPDQYEGVNTDG